MATPASTDTKREKADKRFIKTAFLELEQMGMDTGDGTVSSH
jgi:hypothetical protein